MRVIALILFSILTNVILILSQFSISYTDFSAKFTGI